MASNIEEITDSFKALGQQKLMALALVAVVLLGGFAFMMFSASGPAMAPLFNNISMAESSKVVAELEARNIPYKLLGDGSQIMVPRDQVLRLKMSFAEEGIPNAGGSSGYELFDKGDKFGTSSFVQNINQVRAMEGELARTIGSLGQVERARVHLVMPKKELFAKDRERNKPTASVMVKTRGAQKIGASEVRAITNLVAASVPGLSPENVTIVDTRGNLLARGGGNSSEGGMAAANAEEYRIGYEIRTRNVIEELLEKSVGMGSVKAQVTADMDFDKIVTNSETYDPEGKVVRSVQTSEEKEQNSENSGNSNVSVANNLPDANAEKSGSGSASNNQKTDEVTNYEISKTVKNQVSESGKVKKLSIAVLVDGTYTKAKDGKQTYKPRSKEEMAKLEALVKSAVGFDTARGDKLELTNMQFSSLVEEEDNSPLAWLAKDLQGVVQTLVIGLVSILAILLVVKPLVKRAIEINVEQEEAMAASAALTLPGMPGVPQLTSDGRTGEDDELDELSLIQGPNKKLASLKKINEIIAQNPEEVVLVLRQWIYSSM